MTDGEKTILITGGAGFIGSNFIRYLYGRYPRYRLVNLDLLTYAGNLNNLKDIVFSENGDRPQHLRRYHFVKGDVCDEAEIQKIFSRNNFDAVVHFAAESHVDRSIFNVLHFVRTNIEGTRVLIEAARRHKVPRFIHISTDEVYGTITDGFADEDTPLRPSNPYSASKAGADLLLQTYIRTHNFPAVIVRGSNNYGPYQYPEKLIPISITNLLEGRKIPVHGNGLHRRSWLHVEDFCRAIDIILHQAPAGSIYNVAGEEKTNLEVLRELGKHLKQNIEERKVHIDDRPGADFRYATDSAKLERELGWRRTRRFEESIGEVVNWYLTNQDWWRKIRQRKGFQEHYERQSKGQWC